MLHRWFFVVVLLVGLAAMALAADTLLILDKVPVQLPGIRSAQLDGKQRKATLYHERWQVLRAGGPGLLTGGPAEWWHQPGRRYWKAPVEVSLCAPGCLPDSWRFVQAGSLLIDTLLPLQGSVDIWLRQGKQEPPWRVLTAVRPHIQPLLGGYLVKKQGDTLELGARVMQVADYRGKKIPWQPLNNQLPLLPPGNTAELYIHPPPGLPDSSLEYRLQQGQNPNLETGWQTTGHLLRLPNLDAGSTYQLQLRYRGMTAAAHLQVMVGRHWYQQPLWLGTIVMLLCLPAFIILHLRYRKRLAQSEMREEMLQDHLRRLQVQLNPHFLYNALSSIGGLMAANKPDDASYYLAEFGKLMRETMEYTHVDRRYTLEEEIEMVDRYCRIEQLRFGFEYTIDADTEFDPSDVTLPAMLVQPLVENAIQHGIQALHGKGHIGIRYFNKGDDFIIRVTDNGPGIREKEHSRGTGLGLALTRKRLQYMSDLKGTGIQLTLEREGNLTVAAITFYSWFRD